MVLVCIYKKRLNGLRGFVLGPNDNKNKLTQKRGCRSQFRLGLGGLVRGRPKCFRMFFRVSLV